MSTGSTILFATGNRHKFGYITNAIGTETGYAFDMRKPSAPEIQSASIREVAIHKAQAARAEFGCAVAVHDVGMHISALNGFPGAYFKDFVTVIPTATLFDMFKGFDNRQVSFQDWLIYVDAHGTIHEFMHDTGPLLCLGTRLGRTHVNPMDALTAFADTPDIPASDDPQFMTHYDAKLIEHGIIPCWEQFRRFLTEKERRYG